MATSLAYHNDLDSAAAPLFSSEPTTTQLNSWIRGLFFFFLAVALSSTVRAGSATWGTNPTSSDWNTATNWVPNTIPNDPSDLATFGASNVTDVVNSEVIVNVDSLVFNPGAPQYTISAYWDNIEMYGAGIVNNSDTTQLFIAGTFFFKNSATAGEMTHFDCMGGGYISFDDTSSAGSALIDMTDNMYQAHMAFFTGSTAANATINASAGANVGFLDGASGGNATFNLTTEASVIFTENSSASQAIGNCIGGNQYFGAYILFPEYASAGKGTFTAFGGSTSGEKGGFVEFDQSTTADSATFVINGATGAGLTAGSLDFYDTSTAANANITVNGGATGSDGGVIFFQDKSKGGYASGRPPQQDNDIKQQILAAYHDSRCNGQIFLVGGSSGATHALWCALDPAPTVPGWPISPSPIRAVATLSAPCDLPYWVGDDQNNLLLFEQKVENYTLTTSNTGNDYTKLYYASPISLVPGATNIPPIKLFATDGDPVPHQQSDEMYNAIKSVPGTAEITIHGSSLHAFNYWRTHEDNNGPLVGDDVTAFLQSHLQ